MKRRGAIMRLTVVRTAILAFALIATHPANADFEAGQRAWDAGSVDEALSQWRVAANEGDRRAMLALGRLYLQGLGVLQDYVEAHKWLNLAASRGEAAALAERDALSAKMTPAQMATAQERAAAWRPGGRPASTAGTAPDATAAQAEVAPPVPASSPDARRPPPQAIREAQSLLAALGYRPGPADGLWGRRTGAAYSAFLRDAGLPAAEMLTPQALRAMRAVAKRRGVAEAGRGTTAAAETARAPASSEASVPRPAPVVRPDALHRAAQAGDIEVLKAALAAGVDVDARDGQGWTALMHAVNRGHPLLVESLLMAKAEPDVRAPDGATALFIAALHGHAEIVSLLLKAGANMSIKGPQGKTAEDVAGLRADDAVFRALYPAGTVFRDCSGCPELVVVPAGRFTMGSPTSEEGRVDVEGRQHRVEISRPFAVGKYEITRAEFAHFTEATGHDTGNSCSNWWGERSGRNWQNPGYPQMDRDPVTCVNWNDAQAYVDWLSRETGKEYRLLTEAEWEYSARAGTNGPFSFGETISTDLANYDGNHSYGSGRKGVYRKGTVPVGSFPSNGFGLHDMHGNVSEWTEDCWHDSYSGAPSDGKAWISGGDCGGRPTRGGSWYNEPRHIRSASRFSYRDPSGRHVSDIRAWYDGFRIARTLAP